MPRDLSSRKYIRDDWGEFWRAPFFRYVVFVLKILDLLVAIFFWLFSIREKSEAPMRLILEAYVASLNYDLDPYAAIRSFSLEALEALVGFEAEFFTVLIPSFILSTFLSFLLLPCAVGNSARPLLVFFVFLFIPSAINFNNSFRYNQYFDQYSL